MVGEHRTAVGSASDSGVVAGQIRAAGRGEAEHRVGARPHRLAGERGSLARGRRAGPGDNRYAGRNRVPHRLDESDALTAVQRGSLARGAGDEHRPDPAATRSQASLLVAPGSMSPSWSKMVTSATPTPRNTSLMAAARLRGRHRWRPMTHSCPTVLPAAGRGLPLDRNRGSGHRPGWDNAPEEPGRGGGEWAVARWMAARAVAARAVAARAVAARCGGGSSARPASRGSCSCRRCGRLAGGRRRRGPRSARTAGWARDNMIGRAVTGYQELIDDPGVDALYIPLPNSLHGEWTIRALRAGKPVLCEKPLTGSLAETEQVLAVARETGTPLWEAFVFPFHDQMERIRGLLAAGAIGDLREIQSDFHF